MSSGLEYEKLGILNRLLDEEEIIRTYEKRWDTEVFSRIYLKLCKECGSLSDEAMTAHPDITQQELIDELSLDITQPGLARHMKKLGLTLKKDTLSYRKGTGRCYRKKETMSGKSSKPERQ